jgi:hypothetical protein
MILHKDFSDDGTETEWLTNGQQLVVRGKQRGIEAAVSHYTNLRNDPEYAKRGIKNEMQHVASIPNHVYMEWKQKFGFDLFDAHPNQIARFIDGHPEYHYLKVTSGRIA